MRGDTVKSTTVTIRLEPEEKEKLKRLAKANKTGITALIRQWIENAKEGKK
jgi:predicted transcriptional regulator